MDDELELVIPNREILDLFIKLVQEWLSEETRSDEGGWYNFVQCFQMVLLQHEHNWDIESNTGSGLGYSDILIRTEKG